MVVLSLLICCWKSSDRKGNETKEHTNRNARMISYYIIQQIRKECKL